MIAVEERGDGMAATGERRERLIGLARWLVVVIAVGPNAIALSRHGAVGGLTEN